MKSFSVCGGFAYQKSIINRNILTYSITKQYKKNSTGTGKKSNSSKLFKNRKNIYKCGKNFAWTRLALNDVNTSKISSNDNENVVVEEVVGEENNNIEDGEIKSEDEEFEKFKEMSNEGNLVPLYKRIFSDQFTTIATYRCLVKDDDRDNTSFMFESVNNGNQNGRYSFLGAKPSIEIIATNNRVVLMNNVKGTRTITHEEDPMDVPVRISRAWQPVNDKLLPQVFTGGWVGYAGYDTVRYVYKDKVPFERAPPKSHELPDLHLALYDDVIIFDHVTKIAYIVTWIHIDDYPNLQAAYKDGQLRLNNLCENINLKNAPSMKRGYIDLKISNYPSQPAVSNMTKEGFLTVFNIT